MLHLPLEANGDRSLGGRPGLDGRSQNRQDCGRIGVGCLEHHANRHASRRLLCGGRLAQFLPLQALWPDAHQHRFPTHVPGQLQQAHLRHRERSRRSLAPSRPAGDKVSAWSKHACRCVSHSYHLSFCAALPSMAGLSSLSLRPALAKPHVRQDVPSVCFKSLLGLCSHPNLTSAKPQAVLQLFFAFCSGIAGLVSASIRPANFGTRDRKNLALSRHVRRLEYTIGWGRAPPWTREIAVPD